MFFIYFIFKKLFYIFNFQNCFIYIKAIRAEYQDIVVTLKKTIILHKEIKESSEQSKYIN